MDLVRSTIRTDRSAAPVVADGKLVGLSDILALVEVRATFTSDEGAAKFLAAVRDLVDEA